MSSVRTQYEDLSKLAFPVTELLKLCQEKRPSTLDSDSAIHLNDKFCSERGWYCYNTILSEPKLIGEPVLERRESPPELIYSCDNEQNSNPLCSKSIQTTVSSTTTTLSFVKPPLIRLGAQVVVSNVANSGTLLILPTELGERTSSVEKYTATDAFVFDVGAFEKVEVYRTEVKNTTTATYDLAYGIQGLIGTTGKEYDSKQDISYPAENFNASSTAILKGTSTEITYSYKVVRTSSKVQQVNCVHIHGEIGCQAQCCKASHGFSHHVSGHHRRAETCDNCCAHSREHARLAAEDLNLKNEAAQLKAEKARLAEREDQLRLEDARIREVDSRQHEEDARLRKEDQRLIQKDADLQAKEEVLNQREKTLQEEDARLKAEDDRLKAEATRQAEEQTRLQAEETRLSQEDARLKAKEQELNQKSQNVLPPPPPVGEKVSDEVKAKLDAIGTCPNNYSWTRIEGGYVCSGGGHHIWDKDLANA